MSSAADSAAEPGDGRSWWVLLVQAPLVAALYAPTLRLGLLSDAWVLVQQARQGLWLSVTTTTGWHYIIRGPALLRHASRQPRAHEQALKAGELPRRWSRIPAASC